MISTKIIIISRDPHFEPVQVVEVKMSKGKNTVSVDRHQSCKAGAGLNYDDEIVIGRTK